MDKTKPLILNSAANPKAAFRIFLFLYSSQNVFHSDSSARKERINVSVSILKLLSRNIYIECGKPFDIIYTDFSKAFDSVPRKRLRVKLESYGIKGDILRWIGSFLTGRTQCVNVDGVRSGWKKVVSGIPKGRSLGLYFS